MRRFRMMWATFVMAATAVSGSVNAETLPIEGVLPAGSDALATLNTLVMGPFTGREGEMLAIELEQRLRDVQVRHARYFNLEAPRGGADGVVTGGASGRTESRNEMGQRQECVRRNEKGNCKETRWAKIMCTRRVITLNYTLAVAGKRRERLYSIARTAANSELICPDSGEVASTDVVLVGLVAGVANELRLEFAPLEHRDDVRVKEGTEGLQGNAKGKFKDGIRLTKRNVGSACETWSDVDQLVPNHAPTLFNLGLCAESRHDYEGAQRFYGRVAEINRGERYATEAIQRLEQRRHAERQIAAHAARPR